MEKKNTHIIYGFVTALVMTILSTIFYLTDIAFKPYAQYLTYIPFLTGVILNAVAFSKANNGFVTFGSVFSSCFKSCAIITLVLLVWSFISLLVFPEMTNKAMEVARQAIEQKNMSSDQIDQAMEITHKYFKLFMVAGVVFGTMFWGALFSLIGAAIAKKNGAAPIQTDNLTV